MRGHAGRREQVQACHKAMTCLSMSTIHAFALLAVVAVLRPTR